MRIIQIKPKERFSLVDLFYPNRDRSTPDQPPVYETRNQERTYYTCPFCKGKVRFSLNDFAKIEPPTLFSQSDANKFNEIEKISGLDGCEFRDFYCPTCKRPVRVYFEAHYANDIVCELKAVLEGDE